MALLDWENDTSTDWEIIGSSEPYWGVLTSDKYKQSNLSPNTKKDFFASGIEAIEMILEELAINKGQCFDAVLDFGSGVGRLALPMAKFANHVISIEVADSMQKELRKNSEEQRVTNLSIYKTIEELKESDILTGRSLDWINSYMVFQHISPSIGLNILDNLLELLTIGGYFSLHYNIFNSSPKNEIFQQISNNTMVSLSKTLKNSPGQIQMYDYNINSIFYTFLKHGITRFNCRHENHGYGTETLWFFGKKEKATALLNINNMDQDNINPIIWKNKPCNVLNKVILFGASICGKKYLNHLSTDEKVLCFVDNNIDKHGKYLMGLPIRSPEEISSLEYDQIVITSEYYNEILKQLVDMGIPFEKIVYEHLEK